MLVFLVASAANKSSQTTPQTPQAQPQIGQPLTAGNWRYTIGAVERMKEIKGGVLTDTAKGEYVVVPVTLENVGKANFGISGHDFTMEDAAGVKYTNAMPAAGVSWAKAKGYTGLLALSTDTMPPGVPSKWLLVYDVTPGASGLALRLNQAKVRVPLQ